MAIDLKNSKIKRDIDRINILHWSHLLLIILTFVMKYSFGQGLLQTLFKILFIMIYYRMFYKTIKYLYYTYWTFSLGIFLYLFANIFFLENTLNVPGLNYIYFFAIIFLCVEMYTLSSPIYYPVVNWWEFDFRYRHDLPVIVELDSKMEGRLTDLRRGAGCILLFETLYVGQSIKIELPEEYGDISLTAEVMSKRYHSVGREIKYGVRFIFDSKDEKNAFNSLSKLWRSELSRKKKMKFEKEDEAKNGKDII